MSLDDVRILIAPHPSLFGTECWTSIEQDAHLVNFGPKITGQLYQATELENTSAVRQVGGAVNLC